MSTQCFLGLGSNLRTPQRQINQAIKLLRTLPKTSVCRKAKLLRTAPLSAVYQPQYCNTIVEILTTLTPAQLLQYCQTIEKKKGRTRKKRWASRTLDIDILTFGNLGLKTNQLTLPHPEILSRDFVYQPLFEMAPHLARRTRDVEQLSSTDPKLGAPKRVSGAISLE